MLVNIHELLCISVYGASQVRIRFCATTKFQRPQEVDRCPFMINIVTLNLKIALQRGTNASPHALYTPTVQLQKVLVMQFCIAVYGGQTSGTGRRLRF